jgi:uncharacterized protein YerC
MTIVEPEHSAAMIPPMDRIIEEIEAVIQRLQVARALLAGETTGKPAKPGRSR